MFKNYNITYLLFVFFVVIQIKGLSKDNTTKLDSLYISLNHANSDSAKIYFRMEIIEETYFQNPDTVIPLSVQLLDIVEQDGQKGRRGLSDLSHALQIPSRWSSVRIVHVRRGVQLGAPLQRHEFYRLGNVPGRAGIHLGSAGIGA